MKRLLLGLFLALCASQALAQTSGTGTTTGQVPQVVAPGMRRLKYSGNAGTTYCQPNQSCAVLSAVAANASAASRTFVLRTAGYSRLTMQLNYTYSSGTVEVLTCTASLDGGTTFGSVTSTSISSGTGTVSVYSDNYTTSATGNILLTYDVSTYDAMQCTWSDTGGGANDKITLFAVAAVGI